MQTRLIVFAVALAFAGAFAAPVAAAAALDAPSATSEEVSKPCILGSSSDCIIPIYCVREPCPHFP